MPLAPAADVGESNNDKPIGSSREAASRCSHKKVIASSSVLIVGTMCCAAVLYYMAAPPMQLTVDSLSPSGLNATFTRPDLNTTVSASTSNSSFAAVVDGLALFAKQREVHAGYPVVRTRILDASFVTLTTAQNRSVTVEASPDAPLSEPFLRLIYDESPDIQPALKQAAAVQDAAMDAILTEHKHGRWPWREWRTAPPRDGCCLQTRTPRATVRTLTRSQGPATTRTSPRNGAHSAQNRPFPQVTRS